MDELSPLFTRQEWESCLKVLRIVGESPDCGYDLELLERLIAHVYKKTRKHRRKQSSIQHKCHDRELVEKTELITASSFLEKIVTPDEQNHGHFQDNCPSASETREEFYPLQGKSRYCYICKRRYRELHKRYHLLCPDCATFNYHKRKQSVDLSGRYALVTGGRIKIGYQTALRMLRDGAQVIITTRFSKDAARRYAAETDFKEWRDRLLIYAVDFRYPNSVLDVIEHLRPRIPHLDILINNAAQTIRRSQEYYARHIALESTPLPDLPAEWQNLLQDERQLPWSRHQNTTLPLNLSYPLDKYGEALDTSEHNSWTMLLDEIPAGEMLEAQLVNTLAPFLLTARLKSLLKQSPFPHRFIVNVCGQDGQFHRKRKPPTHAHINMSKAGLNMMTRTCAADYAQDNIFMNSVDTGWVTHEGRYSTRLKLRATGFVPPLDEHDGAARIYAPIVEGISGNHYYGKLLRHYKSSDW